MNWNNFEHELKQAQRDLEGCAFFYFEPQSGRIGKKPPKVSNFYNYKLPGFMLASVVEAVCKAELDACYLSYPREFLLDIEENNKED